MPVSHRYDVKRQIEKAGNISYGWFNFIQVGILEPPDKKMPKS
jgi:hypothetical protein